MGADIISIRPMLEARREADRLEAEAVELACELAIAQEAVERLEAERDELEARVRVLEDEARERDSHLRVARATLHILGWDPLTGPAPHGFTPTTGGAA